MSLSEEGQEFVNAFIEEAVFDTPTGGMGCDTETGKGLVIGNPKSARIAMQVCWRSYLDDPQHPNATGSKWLASVIGACVAKTSDPKELSQFMEAIDRPLSAPGIRAAVEDMLSRM